MRFSSRSALQHTVFENRKKVSLSKIASQIVLTDRSTLIGQKMV